MRNGLLRRFITTPSSRSNSSLPFLISSRRYAVSTQFVEDEAETIVFPREGPGISYGLNWALAGKGVVVKDKAFRNLKSSELQQKGATIAESLSNLPIHVRGNLLGGSSEISKPQFSKLLKQVTTHISSISNIYVHDGAIGSSSDRDAKVRVISDNPSAALSVSKVLRRTPTRAVSHDTCPLTVYIASSLSQNFGEIIGLGAQSNAGFIAADIERSSAILCGNAFSDVNGMKEVLTALSGPIISARGGIPLSARLLVTGDSTILLFAPDDAIQSCSNMLVSTDASVFLSSKGVATLFETGKSGGPNLYKLPSTVIFAVSDSSGAIPSVSKLSPGQAAYHFLAGYQNGKFVPAYCKGPSSIGSVDLSKALLSKLKETGISSFLVNVGEGEKRITGKDFVKLVQSTLTNDIPPFESKGGDLESKYKTFLLGKFKELPEEFTF